jgi:hypothetical protein
MGIILLKSLLLEKFALSQEYKTLADDISEVIASYIHPFFKKRTSRIKTVSDQKFVYYNLIEKKLENFKDKRKNFKISKSTNLNTTWGKGTFSIISDDITTIVKFSTIFSGIVSGYVKIDSPDTMYILVNVEPFIRNFEVAFEELKLTVQHELRHIIQLKNTPNIGLPKQSLLSKNTDIFGVHSRGNTKTQSIHPLRDIEFKTNLYEYAANIKKYLNQFFNKNEWRQAFYNCVIKFYHLAPHENNIVETVRDLKEIKKYNYPKYKQLIKELYRLIFEDEALFENKMGNTVEEIVEDLRSEEDEYYYHVTLAPYTSHIEKNGLKVNRPSTVSNYSQHSKGKIFFTNIGALEWWIYNIASHAFHTFDNELFHEVSVFRIKKENLKDVKIDKIGSEDSRGNSYYITYDVPPNIIEFIKVVKNIY